MGGTTTDASNGSVNSMHDSYQPLGGLAPMFNMAIGEVVFGGVGSGLYGMIFYVVIAVFIGGLMVGRTPEYLGKKIGARQVKIVVIAVLVPFLVALAFTAVAVVTTARSRGTAEQRTARVQRDLLCIPLTGEQQRVGVRRTHCEHTLLHDHRRHRDVGVPVRAADRRARAGCERRQGAHRALYSRHPTDRHGPVRGLLPGVIVIIGALTFLPGLALGPIVEHLQKGLN